MAENGLGLVEVQSRNVPSDGGKRAPVKRLDVPASIRTGQLTDAKQYATAAFNSLGLPPH